MRTALLAVLCLAAVLRSMAQVDGVPRDLIEQRIEEAAERLGDDSDVDLSNLFEVLTDHYLDPIDLNHTNAQELSALFLLDDVQIGALLQHIQRNGKLLSFYELQTVYGFDTHTIQMVRPFVTVRENAQASTASFGQMLQKGNHELIIRSLVLVEERRGFMDRRNSFGKEYYYPNGTPLPDLDDPAVVDSLRANSKVYLGSPYKFFTRYRFRYRHNLSMGFTVEKDEGEELFTGTQQSFDFISAHVFLRDMGRVRALAIGDYQAQFGQGLTFWNGLAFAAKSSFTMNVKRNAVGLAPYTSVNENLFMRGAAATIAVTRRLEFTGFLSMKDIDANLGALQPGVDSLGTNVAESTITSFQEDGLHRTYNELRKKDAVSERIIGGHLRYRGKGFSAGTTAAHAAFDTELDRDLQSYNQYEFNGRENTTVGLDWNVLHRNLNWFGEAVLSANGGHAMNTGVLLALDRRVSMSLLFRDYGRDFHGLYSVAFAEGTNPWNERGLYTGLEIRPERRWLVNAYVDQFRFPWLRYQTDAPSQGSDWLAQVTWRPSKRVELYARVRQQDRARNTSADVSGIRPVVRIAQTNYRFNASYRVSESVGLRTRVETLDFQRGSAALQHGFLLCQDIVHRPLSSPVELTLRFALFDATSYDARLYAFEHDLIGVFSIPPYYGRGIRWYSMVRITAVRKVDLWLRYGTWIYQDQDSISSGLQEIPGNMRSDIKAQMRWLF